MTGQKGKVQISTRIENHTGKAKEVRLENLILDANGKMVGRKTLKKRADCGDCVFEQSLTIARPSLWSVEEPCLYQLVSNVYMDNKLVDTDITNFGFRTIRFDKDEDSFE